MDKKNKMVASGILAGGLAAAALAAAGLAHGPSPQAITKTGAPTGETKSRIVDPAAYQRALDEMAPTNDSWRRANDLYGKDHHDAALRELERTMLLADKSRAGLILEDARRLKGRLLLDQGQYRQSLPLLTQGDKTGLSKDLDLALCRLKLGDASQARKADAGTRILRYDARLSPKDLPGESKASDLEARIRLARGLDLFFSGRKVLALDELTKVQDLAPSNAVAPFYAGMSLIHMGRSDEAAALFSKAAALGRGAIKADAVGRALNQP